MTLAGGDFLGIVGTEARSSGLRNSWASQVA